MSADDHDEMQTMRTRMHDLNNLIQNEVTRGATMAIQLTNLVSLFAEHKSESKEFMGDVRETLNAISAQVTKTNGRVNGHDDRFVGIDREIRDLKRLRALHEQKRTTDRPDAITVNIPMNVKTIGVIVAFIVAVAMAGWKAGLFQ